MTKKIEIGMIIVGGLVILYVLGGLIHDWYFYGDNARCFNVSCAGD